MPSLSHRSWTVKPSSPSSLACVEADAVAEPEVKDGPPDVVAVALVADTAFAVAPPLALAPDDAATPPAGSELETVTE